MKGTSIQGRKSGDPAYPLQAPPLPDYPHVTTSLPGPDKEEGEVIPSDADIPDSIARALLDALQENRTGNQLPAMMISLTRVGGPQLQQCLVIGRNHQIYQPRRQGPTVSHTLEGISNQPSTAVPAQISSSRRGLTPTAEAETSVQPDSLHRNR